MRNPNNILPSQVTDKLDLAIKEILTLNVELWDESVSYAIESLKNEAIAQRKHHIFGAKFIADVREHLNLCEKNSAYRVFRQESV